MKNSYRFSKTITSLVFSALILWSVITIASSSGKTGHTTLSSTPGCTCHGAQNGSVVVAITGPDSLQVNETGTYQVAISGGTLSAAGVNIASDTGDLNILDNSLKKLNGELTHTTPKSPSANTVTFDFEYTAPATESSVTVAAIGNSVNLNGSTSGDGWNYADDKLVTVFTTTALPQVTFNSPDSYELEQNYPNPFNPSTTIRYQTREEGIVSLEVFNLLGQKVATLVKAKQPAGSYSIKFDGGNLESGTYIYRLTANGTVQSKRMILLK